MKNYDYWFINRSKYHYIAVTKPNASVAQFLFDFVWITSVIFKQMINLNNIKSHAKMTLPKKFETILNKETSEIAWKYIKALISK